MFGARSETTRFHVGQSKGTDIVFVNLYMHIGGLIGREANGGCKFTDLVKERKKFLAGRAE